VAKGYRHFTQEFKDSAVREVVERSRSFADVANQVGIYEGTLRRWVNAWREVHGDERVAPAGASLAEPVAAADLATRVAELERENRRLREREAILKKAAAFFAQDHL
jgi:transposase-like protein